MRLFNALGNNNTNAHYRNYAHTTSGVRMADATGDS